MSKPIAIKVIVLLILSWASSAVAQQAPKPTLYRLSLPGKDWAVDVPLLTADVPSIRRKREQLRDQSGNLPPIFSTPVESLKDGGYSFWTIPIFGKVPTSTLPEFVIHLNPLNSGMEAAALREFDLQTLAGKSRLDRRSVKNSEHNQIPIARYTLTGAGIHNAGQIPLPNGQQPETETGLQQLLNAHYRRLSAYLVKDNVGIIFTLTAETLNADEEKNFYAVVDSAKFVDTSAPANSFDYYQKSRVVFMNNDYEKALELLVPALRLEKQRQELEPQSWRDLIAKISEACAKTSHRDAATSVIEYGISNDPSNTFFRMTLARLYAVSGDVDKTLAALDAAFAVMKREIIALKKVSIGEMSLPDLSQDPAFKEMMKSETFRNAVKAMRK
jgi:tetratricopeptide (TPR) repeat protein